jgi:hypothetical protein
MSFDWNQVLREEAARLLTLSRLPGWKEYAEDRIKKMAASPDCESFRDELNQMCGMANLNSSES